jgi:hypothetical protein
MVRSTSPGAAPSTLIIDGSTAPVPVLINTQTHNSAVSRLQRLLSFAPDIVSVLRSNTSAMSPEKEDSYTLTATDVLAFNEDELVCFLKRSVTPCATFDISKISGIEEMPTESRKLLAKKLMYVSCENLFDVSLIELQVRHFKDSPLCFDVLSGHCAITGPSLTCSGCSIRKRSSIIPPTIPS